MPVKLDLSDPEETWAEACATALLSVSTPGWGATVRDDGVRTEDVGNGWHGMSWVSGGRALLYGYDVDYSETRFHVPPIDLLAGGPDWLPWEWLAEMMRQEFIVQYVYWWDGETWAHTDYPGGLEDGGGALGRDYQVESSFLEAAQDPEAATSAFEDLVRAARARAVDRDVVEALLRHLDPESFDIKATAPGDAEAVLAVAERAGLTPGSVRPELPAGRGEPAGRRAHLIDDLANEWDLFEESFMDEGVPPHLCWSPPS
ncbi:hypothetical protein [Actinomadura opuntiae]|uniref:hypothetical protein n=1 Tax=Actinomadura sp. OS1-43 TaxID=604315 RepID=UPI00255AE1C5|nr:hypothetical protein [Actinomadura sp. OS1-43]MDL4816602.1 hypothetical protein [Actinomadura sp. OS1-43]